MNILSKKNWVELAMIHFHFIIDIIDIQITKILVSFKKLMKLDQSKNNDLRLIANVL